MESSFLCNPHESRWEERFLQCLAVLTFPLYCICTLFCLPQSVLVLSQHYLWRNNTACSEFPHQGRHMIPCVKKCKGFSISPQCSRHNLEGWLQLTERPTEEDHKWLKWCGTEPCTCCTRIQHRFRGFIQVQVQYRIGTFWGGSKDSCGVFLVLHVK